jgi:hypothetical protein
MLGKPSLTSHLEPLRIPLHHAVLRLDVPVAVAHGMHVKHTPQQLHKNNM